MEAKRIIFAQKSAKNNLNFGLNSMRVSREKAVSSLRLAIGLAAQRIRAVTGFGKLAKSMVKGTCQLVCSRPRMANGHRLLRCSVPHSCACLRTSGSAPTRHIVNPALHPSDRSRPDVLPHSALLGGVLLTLSSSVLTLSSVPEWFALLLSVS
jgi:hypothetical protein